MEHVKRTMTWNTPSSVTQNMGPVSLPRTSGGPYDDEVGMLLDGAPRRYRSPQLERVLWMARMCSTFFEILTCLTE